MFKILNSTFLVFFIVSSYFSQGLESLGPKINTTKYTECAPFISPDGNTLYFSRQNVPGDKGNYDIYCSELDAKGKWKEAKNVLELNNKLSNRICHISPDGNEIVLLGIYGDNPTEKGLSIARKTSTGWTIPTAILFENEAKIKWGNNDCSISPNGNVMIISLSSDLYVSFKKGEIWSEPKAFPSNINTSSNEYTPYLSSDNKTVYFSGGGHGGLGSNDIFKTTRLDETWTKWSNPENIGEPINSDEWQSYFRLSAKGDYAYVYMLVNNGDIFRVKLKEEAKPNPVVLVKGKVLDSKTKKPISGASISYELLVNGNSVGTAISSPETGEYQIVLGYGENYGFSAVSKGYISVSENIDLSQLAAYQEITRDLYLSPLEVGAVVRLNNIFFDVGASTLRVESNPELNKVAKLMAENPTMKIEIAGHTDSDGGEALNKSLSQGRAKSVMDYLLANGVEKTRIVSIGYGESKPLVENTSEENKQVNRRVEFRVLSK